MRGIIAHLFEVLNFVHDRLNARIKPPYQAQNCEKNVSVCIDAMGAFR